MIRLIIYRRFIQLLILLCVTFWGAQSIYSKDLINSSTIMPTKITKKLFLCSSFADVAPFLSELSMPLKGKTVAFIPTASIHETYTQYIEDGRNALCSLGLIVQDLEITQHTPLEIAATLDSCDYMYVSGGNTFFLLQELVNKGADKLILAQINQGKLYIGESAGAMILSPDIEYVQEMDDAVSQTPHFHNFEALNVVDFYPVPHYNSFPFEAETQQIMQKYNDRLLLKPITNEQALVVQGQDVQLLGAK